MSTEHQQYSTANQSIAILKYAADHHMDIVRTYADHGKSGLDLSARDGLQSLLRDALAPGADFRAVLVYDVSRWGRFQNPDESASYEYQLHLAGIPVHYCAEPFENDGSLATAILKAIKRGMAGEYSRELSEKVWAGNRRMTELGYHIGGIAGYGFRRQLIGGDGKRKQILELGDRKSLQSEHVILVPGPANEIRIVHEIYKMYIEKGMTELEIARWLNHRRIPWIGTQPWTYQCVRTILTNPKYIGASVYNRKSRKLHKTLVLNPRSEWIWRDNAFAPIVSTKRFEEAQMAQKSRSEGVSDQTLLDDLKILIKRKHRVTEKLIDAAPDLASSDIYRHRFGSLRNAYLLAGWQPARQKAALGAHRHLHATRQAIIDKVIGVLSPLGSSVQQDRRKCLITTDSGITLSLVVAHCTRQSHIYKYSRWLVAANERLKAHLRVVARLTADNDGLMDFFIFPNGIIKNSRITLSVTYRRAIGIYRFDGIETLSQLLLCIEITDSLPVLPRHYERCMSSSASRFTALQNTVGALIADEDFRTLLRAEGYRVIPQAFWKEISHPGEQAIAVVICEAYLERILVSVKVRRFIERRQGEVPAELNNITFV